MRAGTRAASREGMDAERRAQRLAKIAASRSRRARREDVKPKVRPKTRPAREDLVKAVLAGWEHIDNSIKHRYSRHDPVEAAEGLYVSSKYRTWSKERRGAFEAACALLGRPVWSPEARVRAVLRKRPELTQDEAEESEANGRYRRALAAQRRRDKEINHLRQEKKRHTKAGYEKSST